MAASRVPTPRGGVRAAGVVRGGRAPAPGPGSARKGVVCFINATGFLNGLGLQKIRAELRRDADDIWMIDCSPEGHQPEVASRVFQGVQHPVCIVLAARRLLPQR